MAACLQTRCEPARNAMRATIRILLVAWALFVALAASAQTAAPPAILLANVYAGQVDPTAYLVSEKYDGVRAIWDGSALRFRSGRPVPAPAWFIACLPKQPLDGELWLGRGRFDALSGLVRRDPPDDAGWREVRYMLFELPDAPGSFEERARAIVALVRGAGCPALQAVEQTRVGNRADLKRRLDRTVAQGGEGLMLHLASAPYATGRSDVLLKLKPYLDTEAKVVGHRPGKGKHAGRMGALELQTPAGLRFRLGTGFSDAQRSDPPPIGSLVTYRYRDLTPSGRPRFASFLRIADPP